jgi:hypothetical protein
VKIYQNIEKKIIERFTSLLKPHKFELSRADLEKEHFADFILFGDRMHYIFSIQFLHYEKGLAMEAGILASYDQMTELAKKVISWDSEYFKGYLAISSRLGLVLNPKNENGFSHDNDCLQIEVNPNEEGIEKAISILLTKFFEKGAMDFIEKTNTMQKADLLVNIWVKKGEPLRKLVYFTHLPWQITTGIVLAKLTSNPRYEEILDVYETFIRERLSPTSERILDFKAFVEYFKKNGR